MIKVHLTPTKTSVPIGVKKEHILKPKGLGIMVLDFVEERGSYLALNDAEQRIIIQT